VDEKTGDDDLFTSRFGTKPTISTLKQPGLLSELLLMSRNIVATTSAG
jgi:hypothetical protein